MATLEDFKDMQVTIFKGYKLDTWGADGEDLAICTETIKEIEAYEFMRKVYEAKDKWEYEEITEKEYREILQSLISD